jgi:hypothetical protein
MDGDFGPWMIASAWIVAFAATNWVARLARSALARQQFIRVEEHPALAAFTPGKVVAQIVFALLIFLIAYDLGEPYFAFFGGGLFVTNVLALALNYNALMFARALNDSDAATGRLDLSARFSLGNMAHRVIGCALACVVLGLVLGNLALLGGAFFLGVIGFRLLRRARDVRAVS